MNQNSTLRDDFAPIEEGEEDLCRALWIAVIVQAYVDAGGKSSKAGSIREQQRAADWLSSDKTDGGFATVCDLAGICFPTTQKRVHELLRSDQETLDFRCLTKPWGKSQTVESRARFFQRARRNARNRRASLSNMKAPFNGISPQKRCG